MRSVTTASGLSLDGAKVQSVDRVAPAIGGVFDAPDFDGHEQVVHFCDPHVGLHAIVAIHSTVLGPALGGTRRRHATRYVVGVSKEPGGLGAPAAAAERLAERRLRRAAAAA
jgi:hypothetical protein